MAYTLTPTTKAPILNQDGNPIPEGTTSVRIEPGGIVGLAAVAGNLFLEGLAIGTADVTITPTGGAPVLHAVTVAADPFDWTLGAPVPK